MNKLWGMNSRWGNVALGDDVTSEGRHGAGQPAVEGKLERLDRKTGVCMIRLKDGSTRNRSINNLRRVNS